VSLRRRVFGLVAAAVTPLSALLLIDSLDRWTDSRERAKSEALAQAGLLAGNIGMLLDGAHQLARAVAARMQEAGTNTGTCSAYLRSIMETAPRFHGLAVVEPDGSVRCSAAPAPAGLNVADRAYFQAALKSTELVIGDVLKGRAVGQPSLPLALAYRNGEGAVAGVVVLPLNLERLAGFLAEQFDRPGGLVLILDRQGTVAARIPDHAGMVGRSVPTSIIAAERLQTARAFEENDDAGNPQIMALIPVQHGSRGLFVVVGLDRALALASAREAMRRNLLLAGAAIVLAFLGAWLVARRLIERPIRRFVETAQRQERGELSARFDEGRPDTEFGRLGAALNAMAASIERLMGQKTLLIREVQHRVMNSLQLLASFLHLQARQVKDESALKHLRDMRERIVSMSLIYRHLYHAEATSTVEFAGVLRAFCAETGRAYLGGGNGSIVVDADTVEVPMEAALSLALVTHELITNALKHAYPGGQGGPLEVSLKRRGGVLELAVADSGIGLPAGFDPKSTASLGMAVIQSLARQLRGTFTAEPRGRGARFAVEFPLPETPPQG
jgi:two-component sensor histidine kinase